MSAKHDRALWARVDKWREVLQTETGYGALTNLELAYQNAHSEDLQDGTIEREIRVANNPFAAAMYYVQCGEIPPPEILLALMDCWHEYLVAGDMERAFLGPPKKKAGNYAKQRQKFMRDQWILTQAVVLVKREGMTLAKAAETISNNLSGMANVPVAAPNYLASVKIPNADSIERMLHGKFNKKKAE